MLFNVVCVQMSLVFPLPSVPGSSTRPPRVIKMEEFQEKESGQQWHSGPVYSRFGGYKMCLRVVPNGCGDGKGSYTSLAVCLLQGDNDANLKWPCNATVAVSVLNQLQDGQHCTSKINMSVNALDRMTRVPDTPNSSPILSYRVMLE